MNGIHYITNEKGKRISVVLDLRKHAELWEDFCDIMLARESANDETIPWEEAKRQMHEADKRASRAAAKRQTQIVKRSKRLKK